MFDSFYRTHQWYYQLQPSEELAEFVDAQGLGIGKMALDLGCGEGRDSIFLAQRGYEVTAVDLSPVAIEKLNQHASSLHLPIKGWVADVARFSIAPQVYDFINAVTILCHMEADDASRLARSVRVGLVIGGVLFAEVFTVDDPGLIGRGNISETAQFVKHYFCKGELRSLFDELEVLRYEEKTELDISHGDPHMHGIAILVARKT